MATPEEREKLAQELGRPCRSWHDSPQTCVKAGRPPCACCRAAAALREPGAERVQVNYCVACSRLVAIGRAYLTYRADGTDEAAEALRRTQDRAVVLGPHTPGCLSDVVAQEPTEGRTT